MRKIYQHIAPFLAVYLLLVSVGIPLQRVYCACVGQASIQLPSFLGDMDGSSCHVSALKEKPVMACCKKVEAAKPANCCSSKEASENGLGLSSKCLTTELFFVHFQSVFTLDKTAVSSDQLDLVTPLILAGNVTLRAQFPIAERNLALPPSDFPASYHAASFQVRYQCFLC